MSLLTADVVVIGGGIVGASVAYWCGGAGLRVVVLDQSEPAREASWATAGIVGVQPYEQAKTPFTALLGLGTKLHRQWAIELREETGIDPGYVQSGGIELARNGEEAHSLRSAAGHYRAHGVEWVELPREELKKLEPHLGPEFTGAYYVPEMAQIRPPRFMRALIAACEKRGVQFLAGQPALAFVLENGTVVGVRTPCHAIHAACTVIAAGAWSGELVRQLGICLPVRPIRGQIALLSAPSQIVRHILMVDREYVVPRHEGRYLIGSTQEDVGFDRSVTAGGIKRLLDFATWLCPPLGDARVEATWSGFRPANPDGKPFIGGTQRYKGLLFATGHFRSGVLAAPSTGLVIKQLICGEEPVVPLWPFNPDRPLRETGSPLDQPTTDQLVVGEEDADS